MTFFHKVCLVLDCGNIIDLSWTQRYGQKLGAIVFAGRAAWKAEPPWRCAHRYG